MREKKSKKFIASIIATVMLISVLVFVLPPTPTYAAASPKLSAQYVTLAYGGKQTIKLTNGKGKWSIENNGVIKVKKQTSQQITVAPVRRGTATVTCMAGGKRLACKVKVINNRIGKAEEELGYAAVVGSSFSFDLTASEDVSFEGAEYDKKVGKVTIKKRYDKDEEVNVLTIKIKALKPGRFSLKLHYLNNGEAGYDEMTFAFINGFRGKAKVKKTAANYKKWRRNTIKTLVSKDMSTWEIIDAIGMLISTGRYSMKGGTDGMQLWYGGNGTCVSGSKMMNDFMKDLGVNCKIHFAGNDAGDTDMYGYNVMYGVGHKNVRITLGGKKYVLNPQPESAWPLGTIKR